ncbi:MAG: aminotransferase class V-fold PLP-dependent enzyme [Betaproteobacteria bacterium]|nr:aminotransferase class V-fold PLP-dependent enzyme [Betaproteobacteria bacterium]
MIPLGHPMRRRFHLEPGTAFLNHGSFGATPRTVLAAAQRWRLRMEANSDRFLRYVLPDALRAAAGRLARFVHPKEQDIVFVENATSGVNAVLRSLELRPGDEILATTHTYNAVRQTIREVCRRFGAKLIEANIELPIENEKYLEESITKEINKRTRLLVVDHISSPTGLIFPVKRLAAVARARRKDSRRWRARARPVRARHSLTRRRLVRRQLPQMAVRAQGLRLPVGAAQRASRHSPTRDLARLRQGFHHGIRLDRHEGLFRMDRDTGWVGFFRESWAGTDQVLLPHACNPQGKRNFWLAANPL